MYKSFRVENFRGFRDLQLDDLGRINLIAGKNNAGKTSLLEAMHIHSGNRNRNTLLRGNYIVSWEDIFHDFGSEKKIKMTAELFVKTPPDSLTSIDLEITRSSVAEVPSQIANIFYKYEAEDEDSDDNEAMLVFEANYEVNALHINPKFKGPENMGSNLLPSDFLNTHTRMSQIEIARLYSRMKKSGNISIIIEALRIVEPKLRDLDLLYPRDRPLLYVDIGLGRLLPITSLGEGMNRIAELILSMTEVKDGVLFVDEIENGFHYSIQEEVWRIVGQVARNSNIQVFATTHSYEMIQAAYEAFKNDTPYDFRYHRLDRNPESGQIEAVTYNEYGMNAVAEFDFEYEVRG